MLARTVLNTLGFNWHPRLEDVGLSPKPTCPCGRRWCRRARWRAWPRSRRTTSQTLLADPPLPANETEPPPATPAPATLLHLLLRHALQLEYTAAAARLASKQPGEHAAGHRCCANASFSIFNAATNALTWRMLLARPNPGTNNAVPATFLKGLTEFDTPEVKPLGELRAALAHLQGLDAGGAAAACWPARSTSHPTASTPGHVARIAAACSATRAAAERGCASAATAGC